MDVVVCDNSAAGTATVRPSDLAVVDDFRTFACARLCVIGNLLDDQPTHSNMYTTGHREERVLVREFKPPRGGRLARIKVHYGL